MKCPFAIWRPCGYDGGGYIGGPWRIVLHTTEGSTAAGAIETLNARRVASHFVVDSMSVYQLIDTDRAARALAHNGVETNHLNAIQVEIVGFAGKEKNMSTLDNVRRLCQWLETKYNIPRVWPNGHCKPANMSKLDALGHGTDPGGHNRDAQTWEEKGGYYGHEHVPGNTHWDPALTATEHQFLDHNDGESTNG